MTYLNLKILSISFHKETADSSINRYIKVDIEYELAGKKYKFTKKFSELNFINCKYYYNKMIRETGHSHYKTKYEESLLEHDKLYENACVQHYEDNVVLKYWRDL
jgi:hypothetical protein